MLMPTSISVTIHSPQPKFPASRSWMLDSAEHVAAKVAADGSLSALDAGRELTDPYEDEAPASYQPPRDPRAWKLDAAGAQAPAVRDAMVGLRETITNVDWSAVNGTPQIADSDRVRVQLTFAERPSGMDHLQPFELDGAWIVAARTSTDLLAQPALTSVVDAARSVLDAAERARTSPEAA